MPRSFLLPVAAFLPALVTAQSNTPVISAGGVVNAADYTASLAPGGMVAIFGSRLSPATVAASSIPLPKILEGVAVDVVEPGKNWLPAPLYFVSAGQINVQMPFVAAGEIRLRVRTPGGTSEAVTVTLAARAPRVFTRTMDGKGEPILLHGRDYAWVSADSPAVPGEYLVLLMTGLGAVSPGRDAGLAGGDNGSNGPINYLTETAYVSFGGLEAAAAFAGLMPGFPGVYQVNFQVPADTPAGSQALVVRTGSARSQASVAAACSRTAPGGVSAVIPPSGGSLSASGITVTVPPGVYSTASTLAVARASGSTPVDQWRVSDVYTLAGLPATLNAAVTVSLEMTQTGAGTQTLVAVSTGTGVRGAGLQFLEGTVSGNQVTVKLPTADEGGAKASSVHTAAAGERPAESGPEISLYVMTFYRPTTVGDFLLFYPPETVKEADVTALAGVLQQAKGKLESMGLSWSRRTRWPLRVVVYPFTGGDQDKWGMAEPSILGLNYHSISINATKLAGGVSDDLRATCGHELFHILQNLYDPRDAFRIAKAAGSWLWFQEAASTWFENKMTGQTDEVPAIVRQDNYAFLTRHGLEYQPGDAGAVQGHGYGASMFLRYLEDHAGGQNLVGSILTQCALRAQGVLGDSARWPVEAMDAALSGMLSEHWRNFVAAYTEGTLPGSFPDHAGILSQLRERYTFADESTAGKTFTWEAPHLSAGYYLVRFQAWPKETKLAFSFRDPGGEAQLSIYRVRGDTWTLVARTRAGDYEFAKPEELAANGESLVLAVANANGSGRYTGSTPLQITINKGDSNVLGFLHAMTKFDHKLYGPVMRNGYLGGTMTGALYSLPGLTWNGTSFSATAQDSALVTAPDPPYDVTISGTVSADGLKVTSFHYKRYRKFERQSKDAGGTTWYVYDEDIYEWDAAPLALAVPSGGITAKTGLFSFEAMGPGAQGLLSNFNCTHTFYTGSKPVYELQKSTCTVAFESASDGIVLRLSK